VYSQFLETGIEQRVRPGDAHVGRQRQVQASADSRAVDGGDRGQRALSDGHEAVVEPQQSLFGRIAQRAEIGTGAKRFTGTGDDDGVHIGVGLGPFHGGTQLRRHLTGDGVASVGVVDRDQCDVIVDAK
jgi:hypothetical protein